MFEDIIYKIPRDIKKYDDRMKKRYKLFDRSLLHDVQTIFTDVEERGDAAIIDATKKFDGMDLENISLDKSYIDKCVSSLDKSLRLAIEKAIINIAQVNRHLMPEKFLTKKIRPGTVIGEKYTPCASVGLWVPSRKGPLISTALMLTVAAKTAGVKKIIVAMPPDANGLGDPATIAAASIAGADEFIVGNGVAVIAGMSVGTKTVPDVNGIFGPGPNAIAAAMGTAFLYGKKTVVGLGPTEGMIIADESACAKTTAYDMICEAEHGPDSSFVLAATSVDMAKAVISELELIIRDVDEPRKSNLLSVFGENGYGAVVITKSIDDACKVANDYAPEHLMICCNKKNEKKVIELVVNAGEILAGRYTPFSAANYMIGITAVLPTNGYARSFSGITCKDMMKSSSFARLDKPALMKLYPSIKSIGEYERLPCHVKAAGIRIDDEKGVLYDN